LPVVRDPGRASGRGGVTYSYFDYDKMKDEPLHPAGPVSAEQAWERIEYFIKRVIPVAEECKVKMGCHPNDISVPADTTYRGIAPVLGSTDGLKRFIDLHPSPLLVERQRQQPQAPQHYHQVGQELSALPELIVGRLFPLLPA